MNERKAEDGTPFRLVSSSENLVNLLPNLVNPVSERVLLTRPPLSRPFFAELAATATAAAHAIKGGV